MQKDESDEEDAENDDDAEESPPVLPAAVVAAILAYSDNCKLPMNCPCRVCLFVFLPRPVDRGVGGYRERSRIGNGSGSSGDQ